MDRHVQKYATLHFSKLSHLGRKKPEVTLQTQYSECQAKEIFITDNGCASDDVIADDGKIYDTDRIMYLRNYLTQLQRATAAGVPVKGYFE